MKTLTKDGEIVLPPRWKQVPEARERPVRGRPFEVSVNELNSFQRCRRAWDITSASRQSLHRIGMPVAALNIGSAVHYALASHALGSDPEASALVYFQQSVDQLQVQYREVIGAELSTQEWTALAEERDMVLGMIKAYFARYGYTRPTKPYRIVAPEVTFRIPLVPDYDIFLVGTIDRVLVDADGNPIPGEIKTYKIKPNKTDWRFNHQIYGYAAALQLLTKKPVRYALYDGLRKKAPLRPNVLKDGTLSSAWIDTTHAIYRADLLELYGGDMSVLAHPAYAPLLSRLKERDLSPDSAFHTRFRIPISQVAIEQWWDQAQAIAMEMAHDPRIYPNFPWDGCRMCRVRDLCHAIQGGEDTEYLLSQFAVGQTHTRQAKIVATPATVRSVKDLAAYAGSLDPDQPFEISVTPEADPA